MERSPAGRRAGLPTAFADPVRCRVGDPWRMAAAARRPAVVAGRTTVAGQGTSGAGPTVDRPRRRPLGRAGRTRADRTGAGRSGLAGTAAGPGDRTAVDPGAGPGTAADPGRACPGRAGPGHAARRASRIGHAVRARRGGADRRPPMGSGPVRGNRRGTRPGAGRSRGGIRRVGIRRVGIRRVAALARLGARPARRADDRRTRAAAKVPRRRRAERRDGRPTCLVHGEGHPPAVRTCPRHRGLPLRADAESAPRRRGGGVVGAGVG